MRKVVAIVAISLAASVPGCGEPHPMLELNRYLGVTQARESDQIRAVFGRCGNEQMTTVSLTDGGTMTTIWRIDSSGSPQTRFTVGEAPDGFRTSVPFRGPLPPGNLTLTVRTDHSRWPRSSVTFSVDELRPGLYHSDTGPVLAPPDLKSAIRQGCVMQMAHPL